VHHFAVTELFATSSPSTGAAACAKLIRFGWLQKSPKLLPRKFCALPEGEAFWRRPLGVATGDQVGKGVLLLWSQYAVGQFCRLSFKLYLAARPLALVEAGLIPLAHSGRGIFPSFVAKFGMDAYGLRVGASAKFGKFAFAHTRQCVQRKVDGVNLACQRCQSQRVGPDLPSSFKPTIPLPSANG
jgi:hypothetical protein